MSRISSRAIGTDFLLFFLVGGWVFYRVIIWKWSAGQLLHFVRALQYHRSSSTVNELKRWDEEGKREGRRKKTRKNSVKTKKWKEKKSKGQNWGSTKKNCGPRLEQLTGTTSTANTNEPPTNYTNDRPLVGLEKHAHWSTKRNNNLQNQFILTIVGPYWVLLGFNRVPLGFHGDLHKNGN